MTEIWNALFINPLFNLLVFLLDLTGNLGVAIILLTLIIRFILIPVVLPSMRNMKKQRELQPQIDKLKKKYKNDKQKLTQKQMELFKENGLNPASSCLTQLPMFLVLIALYGVIRRIAQAENVMDLNPLIYFESLKFTVDSVNTNFLHVDLAQVEGIPYIFAILSGLFQFLTSKLSMGFTKKAEKMAKRTPDKKDDIAYNAQKQMLYMMPIMTVVIGTQLPAAVVLYMMTTSIFSLVQAYLVMGTGDEKLKV